MNSEWGSGVGWTCAALSDLDDVAHCDNEEIAETCCHCGGGSAEQVSSYSVQITMYMSTTAEGQVKICNETNLVMGGGTLQSVVDALDTVGVSSGGASLTLLCTTRRLASNRIRRLQTDFSLVSSARFTDLLNASTFAESVQVFSSDIALTLESVISTTLRVDANVTVTAVKLTELTVDAASGCRHEEISVLLTLLGVALFNIG